MAPKILDNADQYRELVDSVDTILFDCDGVIYHDDEVVEHVKEVLIMLRKAGKKLLFVTNNASKSRQMLKKKFDKLGLDVSTDEIFGSAFASAVYISKILKLPKDKKVYVIGEQGLEEELDAVGITYSGGSDPSERELLPSQDFSSFKPDPSVGAVICGWDQAINYKKIARAFSYLRDNPGCHFILTNQDAIYPTPTTVWPGSGAISAPLVFATGRQPLVVGKPNTTMMDAIIAEHKFDPKRALMVGDNLATDILFGKNSGLRTLLVFGGVTKKEQVLGDKPDEVVPDYIMESLGDLIALEKQ